MLKSGTISMTIIKIILSGLTTFSLTYMIAGSLSIEEPVPILLGAFSVFLIALFHLLFHNKKALIITSVVFIFIICTLISYLLTSKNFAFFVSQITSFIHRALDYMLNGYDFSAFEKALLILLINFLLCIPAYIFTFKYFNFIIITSGSMVLFILQYVWNFFNKPLSFYLLLFCCLIYYFLSIYNKASISKDIKIRQFSYFTVLASFLTSIIILITLIIPKSISPIEWNWLDNKINSLIDYFNNIGTGSNAFDYFSVAATGFGSNSLHLGGKVIVDKTPVLTVKVPERVYLRGSVMDFYTGSGWERSNKELGNAWREAFPGSQTSMESNIEPTIKAIASAKLVDIMEFPAEALSGITNETISDLFELYVFYVSSGLNPSEKIEATITFQNINTKSIFIPLKVTSIEFLNIPKSSPLLVSNGGAFSLDTRQKSGFSYNTGFYDFQVGDDENIKILKNLKKGYYKQLYDDLSSHSPNRSWVPLLTISSIKNLSEKANYIYEKYLQLPEPLPERVKTLVNAICSPFENDYEKAKAIEKFLSSNFPYTLSPSPPSAGQRMESEDFVDAFLFDVKEGYCTYFATAMAVMARCAGIPSRYVEGFMLPPKPDSYGVYVVTNEQAHAWVELYFEGVGWLPFEPTAPFEAAFYKTAPEEAIYSEDFSNNPAYLAYMENLKEFGTMKNSTGIPTVISPDDKDTINIKQIALLAMLFIFGGLLLAFSGYLVFRRLKIAFFFYSSKKKSAKQGVKILAGALLKLFWLLEYPMLPGETLHEYANRIGRVFDTEIITTSKSLSIVTKAIYSLHETTEVERQVVYDFVIALKKKYLTKHGFPGYFLFLIKFRPLPDDKPVQLH